MKYLTGPLFLVLSVLLPVVSAQSLDTEQLAFLTLINNYRAQNGAGPLQVSATLQASSQWMSTDLATNGYFSHTDTLGRDAFTRMAAFGYGYNTYKGENIAGGNSTAQATFSQWQNSDGHRANMLNSAYTVIGIGRAYNPSSPYRWYWTTDFGGYTDQTIPLTGGGGGSGGGGGTTGTPPVINFFSATPSSIAAGQSTTLSWSVSGATSVTLDNGIGDVTNQTSRMVTLSQTTAFTLTATNSAGLKTLYLFVTVSGPPAADTDPPTTPFMWGSAISETQVNLNWTMSQDNVGVAGYQIFRDGTLIATVTGLQAYADTKVVKGTDYTYTVRAYDAAGNYSSYSRVVYVTTPGTPAPSAPQSVTVAGGSGQTGPVAAVFLARLQAKVLDAKSQPISGVTVTFSAPKSGPSAFFGLGPTDATAVTDSNGMAMSPVVTANGIAGTYTITASVSGLAPASFTLTNTALNTPPAPPPSSASASIWGTNAPDFQSLWFYQAGAGIELGVRFRSDVSGSIVGVRFLKTSDSGTHTGSLWSKEGTLLATGTFTNETSSGWQTLMFKSPVPIAANTTYIASYHTNAGSYPSSPFYFWSHGTDSDSLHALVSGADGPNGVFAYGGSTIFPSSGSSKAENYWVDVIFAK